MAKKFTLVDCDDVQKVVSSFIELDALPDVTIVLEYLANVSSYEKVKINISHMVYKDGTNTLTDATPNDVEMLQDKLPELFDTEKIEFVELIELEVDGLAKDEVVEVGDI